LCWYEDGDEKYISIEGVPYQKPNAQSRIYHKDGSGIPNLSVGAQQSSLGDVLGRAFEPLALPSTKVYPIQNFRKFDVFLRISDRIFPTFV
jgi:hypothetical protein